MFFASRLSWRVFCCASRSVAAAQIMSGMRNQPTGRDLPTMPLDTNVGSDVRPTFRLKVTRVEVSALVVDADGQPVRDLKASEFEVYDGGRKQQIQSFAAYTYNGGSIPLDTVDSPSDPNNELALVTNAWSSSSRVIGLRSTTCTSTRAGRRRRVTPRGT